MTWFALLFGKGICHNMNPNHNLQCSTQRTVTPNEARNQIRDTDIICGDKNATHTHPGNIHMRSFVSQFAKAFQRTTSKYGKGVIIDEIVVKLEDEEDVRFLQWNSATCEFSAVDEETKDATILDALQGLIDSKDNLLDIYEIKAPRKATAGFRRKYSNGKGRDSFARKKAKKGSTGNVVANPDIENMTEEEQYDPLFHL
jgi:hypothetical protein